VRGSGRGPREGAIWFRSTCDCCAGYSYPHAAMSKRSRSPPPLPQPKRLHGPQDRHSQLNPLFQPSLSDELILCIFSHLSSVDLCAAQATSKTWSRLAADNELWRKIYLKSFGRARLRGGKGFVSRADGRDIKPLPSRADGDEIKDWKWMFRISSNWRKGNLFAR
jgi:hypothetical protein